MKKILCVLATLLILCACSGENGTKNPVVEYNSLDEINEVAKVNLISPGVMGKTNERYSIIDKKIAEYDFELNGYEYTLRGADFTNKDISGLYFDGKEAFTQLDQSLDYNNDSTYKAYRFIINNKQYVLMVKDNNELDYETFFSQFSDIYSQIIYESTSDEIKQYIGQYYDTTSQRAVADISLSDVNKLYIDITWSNSASEYEEWIINADVKDNKITYDEIVHMNVKVKEDGTLLPEVIDDYGAGYFEIKDNKLKWTGSGNSSTSSCVFEKPE